MSLPTLEMTNVADPQPRRWPTGIWVGAIVGLILGMLALVLIFSMEYTPDVDSAPPAATP